MIPGDQNISRISRGRENRKGHVIWLRFMCVSSFLLPFWPALPYTVGLGISCGFILGGNRLRIRVRAVVFYRNATLCEEQSGDFLVRVCEAVVVAYIEVRVGISQYLAMSPREKGAIYNTSRDLKYTSLSSTELNTRHINLDSASTNVEEHVHPL